MVISFLDTSALAKRYLDESKAEFVHQVMQQSEILLISDLAEIEMSSVIERAKRESRINSPLYRDLSAKMEKDLSQEPFRAIAISKDLLSLAKRLLRQRRLRVADSIQLASAITAQKGFGIPIHFLSFDHALTDAAKLEGLKCPDLD